MVISPENIEECVRIISKSGSLSAFPIPTFSGWGQDINFSEQDLVCALPLPIQGAIIINMLGELPPEGEYDQIINMPIGTIFLNQP